MRDRKIARYSFGSLVWPRCRMVVNRLLNFAGGLRRETDTIHPVVDCFSRQRGPTGDGSCKIEINLRVSLMS